MSVSSSCFLCIIHPPLFPAPFPRLSYPVYPDFSPFFILYLFASSLPSLRPGSLSQWAIFKDDSIPRMHLEESEMGREVSLIAEVRARMNKCVHCIWGARDKDARRGKELITYKLKNKKKGKRLCRNNFFLFFSVLPTPIKSCPSPLNAPVAH